MNDVLISEAMVRCPSVVRHLSIVFSNDIYSGGHIMSFETRLEIIWHVQLSGPIIYFMSVPFALVALIT